MNGIMLHISDIRKKHVQVEYFILRCTCGRCLIPTDTIGPHYLDAVFAKSERYLRAAKIIQSLVSILTVPLTSAVCSQAAVVYIQRKRGNNRPTLRQSMALADRGWTDIKLMQKLVLGEWKKYMTSLLLFALFLHLLGEFTVSLHPFYLLTVFVHFSQALLYHLYSSSFSHLRQSSVWTSSSTSLRSQTIMIFSQTQD